MCAFSTYVRTYRIGLVAYSRDSPRHTSSHGGRRVYVFAVRQRVVRESAERYRRARSTVYEEKIENRSARLRKTAPRGGGRNRDQFSRRENRLFELASSWRTYNSTSCARITEERSKTRYSMNFTYCVYIYINDSLSVNFILFIGLCSSFTKTLKTSNLTSSPNIHQIR